MKYNYFFKKFGMNFNDFTSIEGLSEHCIFYNEKLSWMGLIRIKSLCTCIHFSFFINTDRKRTITFTVFQFLV